jgi:hypothetical protein
MANASKYLEENLLDHVLVSGVSFPECGQLYVGIVNDNATLEELENGDMTNEITGYTGDRKPVSLTKGNDIDGATAYYSTSNLDFEDMPNVTIGYAVITDSQTIGSGNILFQQESPNERTAQQGDIYRIPSDSLIITAN